MDFVSSTGFCGSFTFSCLLTLDLDNFHFIQVDFVADGGFLLIIHIGFRKFWWILWISIFRPTGCNSQCKISQGSVTLKWRDRQNRWDSFKPLTTRARRDRQTGRC